MTLTFTHSDSVLTIDLDAIAHNWRTLDGLSAERTQTSAVIKANAYGLGVTTIGPHLAKVGCKIFFVMSLQEGIELRSVLAAEGYAECGIFCLAGPMRGQDNAYLENALMPVINNPEQLARVSMMARRAGIVIPAALHLDTGMSRLGLSDSDCDWLIEQMSEDKTLLDGIDLRYIMSHLTSSELATNASNASQWQRFNDLHGFFPGVRASLANSGGIELGTPFHFDLTRPGIGLYGQHPAGSLEINDEQTPLSALRNAIQWDARILQIRKETKGATVGYGGTYRLARDSVIVSAAVGYADGYRRALGDKATVEIGGMTAPVVGRVSMDIITIDATDIPEQLLRQADSVCVMGPHYSLAQMAADADTIPYEILTCLGARLHRAYSTT